jgi:hypothetical protein
MGRIKSLTTDWDNVTIKAPSTERIVTMKKPYIVRALRTYAYNQLVEAASAEEAEKLVLDAPYFNIEHATLHGVDVIEVEPTAKEEK